MKIDNGKIVEATESELYEYWYTHELFERHSFSDYMLMCQDAGAKIVNEAAENSQCSDCAWYHIYDYGLAELRKENDCLRAALKPVLECDCQLDNYPTKEAYMAALDNSINEAKRIYNGSKETEVKE